MSKHNFATPEVLREMDAPTINEYCTRIYAISLEGMDTFELTKFLVAVQDVRAELDARIQSITDQLERMN